MTDAPEAPRQEREALAALIDEQAWAKNTKTSRLDREISLRIADRIITAGYVTPEAHAAAIAELRAYFSDLPNYLAELEDKIDAHAAALREAWEAGRDAAADEIAPAADMTEEELTKYGRDCRRHSERILALTPPAPKGDDR
jgi:hypothetical protein